MSADQSGRGTSSDETLIEEMDRLHPEAMAKARAELGPPPARRRGPRQSGRTPPSVWPCCQHWCDCELREDTVRDQHDRPCQQDGCQVDDPDAYLTTPARTPSSDGGPADA